MASLMLGSLDLTVAPYNALVGSSLGSWESITSSTSSLFLDGSVVSGEATANREVSLQVFVEATSRAALSAACEALIGEANKASNTLTLTPDVGAVVVYEVFRASRPARVDDEVDGALHRVYSLSFPALPFARSATRETPAAIAPAITLEDFEADFTGALLLARPTAGSADWWVCPVGSAATTPIVALVATTDMDASMTAVTNVASITYPSIGSRGAAAKTVAQITATAAGLVEARSASSWPVSGDMLTVAVNLKSFPSHQSAQAGVEWLDAGGATLRIDWGTPLATAAAYTASTAWSVSQVPAGAVTVRVRLRIPAATVGQVINAIELLIVPSTLGTVTPVVGSVHDGTKGLYANMVSTSTSADAYAAAGYAFRALAAAVDLSSAQSVFMWVRSAVAADLSVANEGAAVSVRLFDSVGRWSRFWFTSVNLVAATWAHLQTTLTAPYQSSTAGAVDLTDVVAYDIDMYNGSASTSTGPYLNLDTITVGPTPTASTSSRGTVFTLDPIVGSARTVAAVTVSSGTALTDWLVAAIDGTTGAPLLTVTTNVATVTAPAGYEGVYSILGCIAPATVLAAPTCTIVQKNAGVTVATRVLTGTTRVGNRYVDFGACELPLVATPPENVGVSYTFTLAPSSASWVEVLVIDVDASLAWVDNQTALKQGWIDEPDIVAGLGKVWVGTATDKTDATALALPPTMSRPLQVKAPSTRLLVYSTTVAPDVALSYYPRWLVEPS